MLVVLEETQGKSIDGVSTKIKNEIDSGSEIDRSLISEQKA